jgi:cell wall-associated NlpC family hydrolase
MRNSTHRGFQVCFDAMDVSEYLAVPFVDGGRTLDGWDCWGCVWWLLAHRFDVRVPSYTKRPQGTPAPWLQIEPGDERVGDVLLFRPLHAGLIIKRGRFIHSAEGKGTVVERYKGLMWKKRIEGFYRWGEDGSALQPHDTRSENHISI